MPPRVLLVQADANEAMWLSQLLASAGFLVSVAFDAASGHTVAMTTPPDLVLVELYLARTGGVAFARHLRELFPQRPLGVVYLVPHDQVSPLLRDSFLALDEFVLAPVHVPALIERLHRLQQRIDNLTDVVADLGRHAARFQHAAAPVRMRLTILFADVRGFTGISSRRDPETVAAAMNNLLEHMAASVLRFAGVIDKFLGDGMMAVFGMDERTAQHEVAAMFAAQEIVEGAPEAQGATLFAGVDLGLGVGLHTGEAVVGPVGPPFRRDVTVIGDTVNMASRVCGEAAAGEILVSEQTFAGIADRVALVGTRVRALKGKPEPARLLSVKLR